VLKHINEDEKQAHIKTVVVDTINGLMVADEMRRMKEKGFDFTDIDDASMLPKSLIPVIQNDTDAFAAFNQALSDLNKSRQVPVADAVTYLISDFLEVPIALKCLNELNYYAVKTELLKRYRIQLNKQPKDTTLLDFLDADDE
jgi:hypothetical protein